MGTIFRWLLSMFVLTLTLSGDYAPANITLQAIYSDVSPIIDGRDSEPIWKGAPSVRSKRLLSKTDGAACC